MHFRKDLQYQLHPLELAFGPNKFSWNMYESVNVFLNSAIKFFIGNYYVTDAAILLLVVNKL